MAAGDFSASTLLRANVRLATMFKSPNTAITEYNEPAMTARALLTNQTASVDPVLEGSKCVGVKAWFIRTSAIGEVSAPADCTTPGGNEAETVGQNYDSEVIFHGAGTAKDERCNNEVEFVEESAAIMRRLIAAARKKLNTLSIQRLAANAQVNLDPNLDQNWDPTTESPRILVPQADFTWDNLGEFEAVVANNKFGEHFYVSGRNFYHDWWKGNYERLNDDGKAAFAAYADQNFFFDLRDMDTVVGNRSTFAVDRNSYVFWNQHSSPSTPTLKDDDTWVWVVPDPELSYVKNGRLVPLMYEIEMKKTCVGRTTLYYRQLSYKFYLRLIGGLRTAPVGPANEKGVLQFKAA